MTIKTIQWNIGGGLVSEQGADRSRDESYMKENLGHVIQVLAYEKPDIITMQEIHDGKVNQAYIISKKLNMPYYVLDHYDKSHLTDDAWLSQSVISRFPITGHKFNFFPNPKVLVKFGKGNSGVSHDKGITTVSLRINSKELLLKTFHMLPFRRTGFLPTDKKFELLRNDLNNKLQIDNPLTLIQGDFNYDSESVKDFVRSVYSGEILEILQTYPTTPEGQKYDHILYKGIKNISMRVIDDVMTDHFPIVAEFEL